MLMAGRRALADVPSVIAKAEACGVDCSEYRQGHAYLSQTIDSFLSQFFPDQLVPPDGTGIVRNDG